jgi:Transglycosylase SLT domain/SPOR domain
VATPILRFAIILICLLDCPPVLAVNDDAIPDAGETVEQSICRLIEASARDHGLPVDFLTRLIWQESSFHPGAVSPAGAQGVAQFMPGTAHERGLADPFDPEQAIPKSADYLADLARDFGNLGLAAAAYNGGPTRVAAWLAGESGLPYETRDYVAIVTRHQIDDWRGDAAAATIADLAKSPAQTCSQITAAIRRVEPALMEPALVVTSGPLAPWGVQLAGSFSKGAALASFARARRDYAAALGDIEPMILGSRLHSRGARLYYRVRVPASTRAEAVSLCGKLHQLGGACLVLRS